ncbi:MAG: hypothetical protein JNL32_07460 [Candidatus Kapabacteria bacterium]|nr:hypothetical protein [Candidatus Kapabacteria bacterium]
MITFRHILPVVIIALVAMVFSACSTGTTSFTASQTSPLNTIRTFAMQLDSNHIEEAMAYIIHPTGRNFMAAERGDLSDELARLRRVIQQRSITKVLPSTERDKSTTTIVEFGYMKRITFTTTQLDSKWYITSISDGGSE